MTMKENQNGNSFDSLCFGKETHPLAFESKARYELNVSRMDSNHAKLEPKDTDDHSNSKVTDDSSMDDEKGTMGSPKKAGQNGLSHHLSVGNENGAVLSTRKESEDTDSLSSDSSDIDKDHRSPEHESFDTVEEFTDCNQNDSRDSSSPLFSDKNALEYNLPDLEVCYKEINCQNLKDVWIDEARHQKDVNLIDSCMDYIDHFEAEEDSSLDLGSRSTADQCSSKEENNGKIPVSQERLDSSLENSLEMDTLEHCVSENAATTGESFFDATCKAETDSSEEDSIVDGKLQIEDSGTQISNGTDGGNKVIEVPDQFLNQAMPEIPAASSSTTAGWTRNDVQVNSLSYSNLKNGNVKADDVEEHSADMGDLHNDLNDENHPDSREAKVDQCVASEGEGSSCENGHEESPGHNQSNSDDIQTDDPAESTSKRPGLTSDAEPIAPNQDGRNTGDVPAVCHLQQDMGETSFSAASLISYSGPVALSGSLSHRSDGSTTSGKSFAFPILQSEWNSSPVRMAKADRRHLRKHKGWRSGVLCCRF